MNPDTILYEARYAKYDKKNQLKKIVRIQSNVFKTLKNLLDKSGNKVFSCYELKYTEYSDEGNFHEVIQYSRCPFNEKWLSINKLHEYKKHNENLVKKYMYTKKRIEKYDNPNLNIRISENLVDYNTFEMQNIHCVVQRYHYQYSLNNMFFNLYECRDSNNNLYHDFKIQSFSKFNFIDVSKYFETIYSNDIDKIQRIFEEQESDNTMKILYIIFMVYYILIFLLFFSSDFSNKNLKK
jgi:hypothetical protein